MKKMSLSLFFIFSLGCFIYAQNPVPSDLNALVGMKLVDAQKVLTEKGYEIAASSLFGKTQMWWSESQKVCVTISFEKKGDHKIKGLSQGDANKCTEGVAAARKVWESYHDGAAPASSAQINAEREKLKAKGFTVSYWIKDAAPGRSTEYWKGPKGECMHIVWNTGDMGDVSSMDCESKYATNPAPKN